MRNTGFSLLGPSIIAPNWPTRRSILSDLSVIKKDLERRQLTCLGMSHRLEILTDLVSSALYAPGSAMPSGSLVVPSPVTVIWWQPG